MGNRIQPVVLDQKFNIAGFIVFLGALTGSILKWKDFSEFFYKGSSLLNWHFFALCIFCSVFAIWFVLNNLWKQEYDAHDLTKKDRDNLMEELRISENERLTDVITGVPNSRSLEKDIEEYFLAKKSSKLQFILIDLKNFRQINKKYGYSKTNNLLRLIA